MNPPKFFKTQTDAKLPLPLFFPDATRALVKSLDSSDIESAKLPGVLVNTLHLFTQPGVSVIKNFGGVKNFMSWKGAVISDSGGFQVMSIAKSSNIKNPVTDKGVTFKLPGQKKILFTPQISIRIQHALKTDLMVVLDDFTPPGCSRDQAKDTVNRTVLWAKQCKDEFNRLFDQQKIPQSKRPYLIGVVQGGDYLDLRRECTERLVEIGFDGLGYGGWPLKDDGQFNYEVADTIRQFTPKDYLLYGLGVGKPQEVANLVKSGWHIFDCVLPTRDARHRRLYVFNADTTDNIDLSQKDFYSFYTPDKEKYYKDQRPVSTACDCLLCRRYSRSYLAHLFRLEDPTAGRLATIHNLRFYSILMEKLRPYLNHGLN
jgi:queuine tRNA-ribosyltransferase